MGNQLAFLYLALRQFVQPLLDDLSSLESFEYLCYRYGWNVFLNDSAFAAIKNFVAVDEVIKTLISEIQAIEDKITADPNYTVSDAEITGLLSSSVQLFKDIEHLATADVSGLIVPLNSAAFWEDFADKLLTDLQERFLRIYYPKAFAFLHLFGVVRYQGIVASDDQHVDAVLPLIDWGQLIQVVKNPLVALQSTYHWNDSETTFDFQSFLAALQIALTALGLNARLVSPSRSILTAASGATSYLLEPEADALRVSLLYGSPVGQSGFYEVGIELLPALASGATVPSGLLLQPVLKAGLGVDLPLNNEFTLQLTASLDASGAVGLTVFPEKVGLVTSVPTFAAGLGITRSDTTNPWYLVGGPNTTRVELSGISIALTADGTVDDPEIKFTLQLGKDASTPGFKVVIPLGNSDNFIKNQADPNGINFSLGGTVVWSSKTGIQINGEATLDILIPFSVQIGALTLKNAHLTLKADDKPTPPNGLAFRVGTQLDGDFGPISFAVDDMGLQAALVPFSKDDLQNTPDEDRPLLGNVDFDLGFAPPKGIGISIDAKDISGSGYLYFDTDKGEYAGVADLNVKGKVNVKAFGVILTHMPDGSSGYSFLLMLSAEFPDIPLGLGFSLSGLGGLVGIHRGIDLENLQQGVYNNDVANVLFPQDPLNDAYALLTAIDRLFPPVPGQYTFGLMAKLSWGPLDIITIEVGLILEFPEPLRLALIGVLRAAVSKELEGKTVTVLQLQVNFAGSIDFDQEFIRFDSSLVKSNLLLMKLEGDMSVRVNYGDNSDFVVSVGGFHPDYQPPALDLPVQIKRIQISLLSGNPSLTVSIYLAVTANTFQFGVAGLFKFEKWGVGVRGQLSFDALFQRNPFHFVTDVHFLLAASWKGYDFASIKLDGSFEGPSPWQVHASLTLSVWIFSKTISLDHIWGDDDDSLLDVIAILPLLADDLAQPGNWERTAGSNRSTVTFRKQTQDEQESAVLWLQPTDLLTVRQSTVPLGIAIDKFNANKPADASTFHVSLQQGSTTIAGAAVQNRFASGQFFTLSDEQALNAPSYELYDSGLTFTAMDAAVFDQVSTQSLAYETQVIDDPAMTPQPKGTITETELHFVQGLLNNALANSRLGKIAGRTIRAAKLIQETYVVVNQGTFQSVCATPITSAAQGRQVLQQLQTSDIQNLNKLAVLPAAELI